MKPHFITCLALLAGMATSAQARPVSYPGGWTVMQMNDMDSSSLHVHYSPTANYSIGYKAEYWNDKNWTFQGTQLNYLTNRWNGLSSQANLYLKSGLGMAYSDDREFDHYRSLAAFTGIAADWETRRYFASYENRATYAGDIDSFYSQKARVGVAPYIGDYGDLHTWLMLQVEHQPEAKNPVTVTPLVRLFKSETMVEGGISNRGDILMNWIVRF